MGESARLTLPQGVLIAAIVVAVFGTALWFASKSSREGARAFEAFGASRGWSYSLNDMHDLAARVEALIPSERYTFSNILTAPEQDGRKIVLFECGYRHADLQKTRSFGTGCLIESPRFERVSCPVEVIVRTWADTALLGGKVEVGRPEFDSRFIVLAKDAACANVAVTPAIQNLLLAHEAAPLFNPVRVVLGSKGAVLLTGYPADAERWEDLVELAKRVEGAL